MYILALKGKENQGAYSVDRQGLKTLYLFVDKDDAIRYARLLEANDYPLMCAVEVDADEAIDTCKTVSYTHLTLPTSDLV